MQQTVAAAKKAHSLELFSRAKANLTGVEKVITSSDSCINLTTSEGGLSILGTALKINKFNADDGTLSIEGIIGSIKYSAAKVPLLKKIFK